ncbi:hypothetical protein K505DRAFT_319961 [Melanomma pulvis-pyrius CBS 109.77]|uniref:Uncharacterized protein n=1 Tax=Melanomma pulvis-pyrius CBS 109.77 TaxID=1314802 RepID=A0A6A6XY50_9PLEO|nr:hypothetical protein K505DRAFT_319961 [Melanomma pulvis-pyrius CBS 109.77]
MFPLSHALLELFQIKGDFDEKVLLSFPEEYYCCGATVATPCNKIVITRIEDAAALLRSLRIHPLSEDGIRALAKCALCEKCGCKQENINNLIKCWTWLARLQGQLENNGEELVEQSIISTREGLENPLKRKKDSVERLDLLYEMADLTSFNRDLFEENMELKKQLLVLKITPNDATCREAALEEQVERLKKEILSAQISTKKLENLDVECTRLQESVNSLEYTPHVQVGHAEKRNEENREMREGQPDIEFQSPREIKCNTERKLINTVEIAETKSGLEFRKELTKLQRSLGKERARSRELKKIAIKSTDLTEENNYLHMRLVVAEVEKHEANLVTDALRSTNKDHVAMITRLEKQVSEFQLESQQRKAEVNELEEWMWMTSAGLSSVQSKFISRLEQRRKNSIHEGGKFHKTAKTERVFSSGKTCPG